MMILIIRQPDDLYFRQCSGGFVNPMICILVNPKTTNESLLKDECQEERGAGRDGGGGGGAGEG